MKLDYVIEDTNPEPGVLKNWVLVAVTEEDWTSILNDLLMPTGFNVREEQN